MRRIEWTETAREDLVEIYEYIAARNLSAADRLDARIRQVVASLPEFPFAHRPGRVAGTREAVVTPTYIVIYRVDDAIIEITQILHQPAIPMTLTHLGQPSALPACPEAATLDYVPNPRPGRPYLVRFTAPEFTSLCPVTRQPDFAHLVIDYAPAETIVESKSLKLFLGAFRNHAAFHEDCTVGIAERLVAEMKPLWLRIGGYWYPRGGIPIDVFWQSDPPPEGLWLPDQGVPAYRGRG